jgi:hypothetical protein
MNKLYLLPLVLVMGCFSKRDYPNPSYYESRLDHIEVYDDSILELEGTIYPSDEYVLANLWDRQKQTSTLFFKKNGDVIWSANIEFELSGEGIDLLDVPLHLRSPDRINSIYIGNDKKLIFIYLDDWLYVVDRSNVLGATWVEVNNEEYNGDVLFGSNVYFCFNDWVTKEL